MKVGRDLKVRRPDSCPMSKKERLQTEDSLQKKQRFPLFSCSLQRGTWSFKRNFLRTRRSFRSVRRLYRQGPLTLDSPTRIIDPCATGGSVNGRFPTNSFYSLHCLTARF